MSVSALAFAIGAPSFSTFALRCFALLRFALLCLSTNLRRQICTRDNRVWSSDGRVVSLKCAAVAVSRSNVPPSLLCALRTAHR